jgi:hypothetical protein
MGDGILTHLSFRFPDPTKGTLHGPITLEFSSLKNQHHMDKAKVCASSSSIQSFLKKFYYYSHIYM